MFTFKISQTNIKFKSIVNGDSKAIMKKGLDLFKNV